jgi:Pyruvate/2-oxoacid:ferredoxin oxidoreductase delta subunit
MPSNWTALHPGFSRESAEAIIARSRPKAQRFAGTILSGRPSFGGLIGLLLGLLLLPISLGYLLAGRFFLGRLFFASYRCDGCAVCARNCPADAIKMWGKNDPRPYWTYRCENCMRCMNFCPKNAIEAGHSWAVILYFVAAIPVSDYVLNWLGSMMPWLASLNRAGIGMLLQYGYMLLAISAAYLIFTLAIRVPAINRLFAFTTLTHYYRRYHEPETRLKDMASKDRS